MEGGQPGRAGSRSSVGAELVRVRMVVAKADMVAVRISEELGAIGKSTWRHREGTMRPSSPWTAGAAGWHRPGTPVVSRTSGQHRSEWTEGPGHLAGWQHTFLQRTQWSGLGGWAVPGGPPPPQGQARHPWPTRPSPTPSLDCQQGALSFVPRGLAVTFLTLDVHLSAMEAVS